jgi:hypothetical protein
MRGLYKEISKLDFTSLDQLIRSWKEDTIHDRSNTPSNNETKNEEFPLSLYVIFVDERNDQPILLIMDRTRTPHELFIKSYLNAKSIVISQLTQENLKIIEQCPLSDLRICFDDNIPGMK